MDRVVQKSGVPEGCSVIWLRHLPIDSAMMPEFYPSSRVHSAYSLAEGAIQTKSLVKLCAKR
jgi:hypothetical protein